MAAKDHSIALVEAGKATRFAEDGFYFPVDSLSGSEVEVTLAGSDSVSETQSTLTQYLWLYKSYLLCTWSNTLVRHPKILDAVETVLGPDILVISANLWVKQAGEKRHVSGHQDAQYYEIEPMAVLNTWVALTEVNENNGCMRFSPRSHQGGLKQHVNTFSPDNMLSHGQTLETRVDETRERQVLLKPGQISMHHAYLAHASGPNRTGERRLGLTIRYMRPEVRVVDGPPMAATLVRGEDRFGHFAPAAPR